MHLECYWFRFFHEKKGGGNKGEREKEQREKGDGNDAFHYLDNLFCRKKKILHNRVVI